MGLAEGPSLLGSAGGPCACLPACLRACCGSAVQGKLILTIPWSVVQGILAENRKVASERRLAGAAYQGARRACGRRGPAAGAG